MYASETGRKIGQGASGETIRKFPRTPKVVTKIHARVEVLVDYLDANDTRHLVRRIVLAVGVRAIGVVDDELTAADALTEYGLHACLGCTRTR